MSKIKVAIIGCGNIANSAHLPAYQAASDLCEVKYFCDLIEERATALRDKYGSGIVCVDYHDVVNDPEVTCVSICTPNYEHAVISIDMLNAKKNVLCEKPAAMNADLAAQMQKAADDNGVILNIGVCNRFNTSVNKIAELIQAGVLGNLYHVYCSFRAHRSIPGLGGAFTTKARSGGGALIDWGVHYLDLILYCLGDPAIKTVSAAAYSVLGKDIEGYVYESMWAGPPVKDGVYDVDDMVTGFVRTEGPTLSFNGAWGAKHRRGRDVSSSSWAIRAASSCNTAAASCSIPRSTACSPKRTLSIKPKICTMPKCAISSSKRRRASKPRRTSIRPSSPAA